MLNFLFACIIKIVDQLTKIHYCDFRKCCIKNMPSKFEMQLYFCYTYLVAILPIINACRKLRTLHYPVIVKEILYLCQSCFIDRSLECLWCNVQWQLFYSVSVCLSVHPFIHLIFCLSVLLQVQGFWSRKLMSN